PLSRPRDRDAGATTDGAIGVHGDAKREPAAASGLRSRFARARSRAPADAVLDPSAQRALAYRSTSTAVALVISQQPDRDRGGELITLLLFALVALSWAPICAVFLAGSIAGPLGRIRAVVTQIVALGDVEKLGRVPIFHRDELGELAQGVNEMIDRLQPGHPDGRPFSPAELPLLRALAGEVIVEEDGVLESPGNHRPVFLRSSAAPIREANGAIAGAVAVARDVTEVADFDRLKDEF